MGNEYTVRCSTHGNIVYHGESRSSYEYYRSGSRQCSQCHAEDEARAAADRRARERARAEENRVRARQAELEKLERERQRERELQRRAEREAEKLRILQKRREEERREKIRAEMLQKSTKEIVNQANKFKKSKSQKKNPFLQYKKLNTLQTVQQICDRVNEVAVVGEVVKQRANQISNDLEDALGDDYAIIKSEINRYKNYGEEMESMTDVFITEFQNVFPSIANADVEEIIELQNEANKTNDDDEKKDLKQEVKENLDAITTAIKNVEAKLFLMEQYYDHMIIDYQYFKAFCSTKQDELASVTSTFQTMADLLRNVDRSVLEGSGDQQKLEFIEEYEYKDTCTEETGWKMKNAIITGAVTGGVTGAVIGGVTGGVGGAVAGAVTGAIVGAGIGALCAWINPYEYKVTPVTKKGYVKAESKLITYKGQDQADALNKIVANIESSESYKTLQRELQENRQKADQQLRECKRLKNDIMGISEKIRNYKSEMKRLTDKFKTGNNVTENQAKMIDKRLKTLSAKIKVMITTMK